MKAGSGKTLGLKQATAHASSIYDTPTPLRCGRYYDQREESAYSRPLNLPDLLSENEATHFPIKLNTSCPLASTCKGMHFFRIKG